MFIIQGPYPLMQSTLLLPSPKMGNHKNLSATVQTVRAMSGKLYTFVKKKRARKVYQWDFVTTKDKIREISSFINQYRGEPVKITDHNGTIVIGYIIINPFEATGSGRAGGYPSGEVYSWTLSLEEKV